MFILSVMYLTPLGDESFRRPFPPRVWFYNIRVQYLQYGFNIRASHHLPSHPQRH